MTNPTRCGKQKIKELDLGLDRRPTPQYAGKFRFFDFPFPFPKTFFDQCYAWTWKFVFYKKAQKIPPLRPIFRQAAFFRASAWPFFEAIFEAIFGLNLRISFLEKGLKCTPVDADFHAGCIFGT